MAPARVHSPAGQGQRLTPHSSVWGRGEAFPAPCGCRDLVSMAPHSLSPAGSLGALPGQKLQQWASLPLWLEAHPPPSNPAQQSLLCPIRATAYSSLLTAPPTPFLLGSSQSYYLYSKRQQAERKRAVKVCPPSLPRKEALQLQFRNPHRPDPPRARGASNSQSGPCLAVQFLTGTRGARLSGHMNLRDNGVCFLDAFCIAGFAGKERT